MCLSSFLPLAIKFHERIMGDVALVPENVSFTNKIGSLSFGIIKCTDRFQNVKSEAWSKRRRMKEIFKTIIIITWLKEIKRNWKHIVHWNVAILLEETLKNANRVWRVEPHRAQQYKQKKEWKKEIESYKKKLRVN